LHGPAEAADAAGLSRAVAAIAETGTLVVVTGADNPATLTLLPETHLVVLPKEAIVGSLEEALARVRAAGPLPRSLMLISGPSRTGDIGGRLVLGAHGPRRLAVFLLSPPS
jgi:L-lactate dehydrogenase complex protein LldG